MKVGKLVADELIYKLAFREIEKNLQAGRGIVLDGAIRSLKQAKKYQNFFVEKGVGGDVLALEVHIADATVMKRLEIRLETFGKQRVDDDPAIMKKRLGEQGNAPLQPILDYYRRLGVLQTVDGEPPIEEVEREIEEILVR